MTSYAKQMTWADWVAKAAYVSTAAVEALIDAEHAYQKLYDRFYPNVNAAAIATALSVTNDEATDLLAALTAGHELYQGMTNVALVAADRVMTLRRFT